MSHQKWKRPNSVPFPSVWKRFDGCKEINGVLPKFYVQDISDEQIEDVIDFMENGFLRDETLCKFSNILKDRDSVEDYRKMWRYILQDKLGLVCFMEPTNSEEKPKIAGVNCTHIVGKDDPDIMNPKGITAKRIVDSLVYVSKKKDFYKELDVDYYLGAMGLYVSPEYRGQNIGFELLKAREPLCRAVGIRVTVTAFTAIGSQKLADRLGYKDLVVISYDDLKEEIPKYTFPGIEKHTEYLRYMYLSFD